MISFPALYCPALVLSERRLQLGIDFFPKARREKASTMLVGVFRCAIDTKREKNNIPKSPYRRAKKHRLLRANLKVSALLIDSRGTSVMEATESPIALSSTSKWICGGVTSAIVAGLFLWNQTIAMDMLTIFLSAASIVYIWFRG